MAPFVPFLVERREAPHPYVIGVQRASLRRAADPLVRRAPTSLVPGASRRSIPSFRGRRKKGKGRARQPEKVKSPGGAALAVRAV